MNTWRVKMNVKLQTQISMDLKNNAEPILKSLGMSINDAVRIFLSQVVIDRGLPFTPRLSSCMPNKETSEAIDEVEKGSHSRVFDSVDKLMADLDS